MSKNLVEFYDFENRNGVLENDSKSQNGFQWYEGGIFWFILVEYIRLTGDSKYANLVTTNLAKSSYGSKGSFLGNVPSIAALSGKWNDDIAWW
jgi:Glycosyl hydrolase family 76